MFNIIQQTKIEIMNKIDLRNYFGIKKLLINSDSLYARQKALFLSLMQELSSCKKILSFASFGDEIDMWEVNFELAKAKKLFLPRIEGTTLAVYQVSEITEDLMQSEWGILEPNPSRCPKADIHEMDCALVPGIGFDKNKMRLGRGLGHYDRLLTNFKGQKWGIGFKEQHLNCAFPVEPHDVAMDSLYHF